MCKTVRCYLFFISALMLLTLSGFAQIPDKFENLKVMPETTTKKQMIQTMKAFSRSLGVRCHFCHVGEKGAPLSSYDFASDDKDSKMVARKMMNMVHDLNGGALKDLEGPGKSAHVSCYTCHRGVASPDTLEDVLSKSFKKEGIDATVEQYRTLREQYYGQGSYNFGEGTLLNVSEAMSEQKKPEAAIALLKLNLEFFPESGFTHFVLGDVYAKQNDPSNAVKHLEKAVELMPNRPEPKQLLEILKGAKGQ